MWSGRHSNVATLQKLTMEDTYYLQDEYLEADSDDDFPYEEVSVEEAVVSSGEEDLETALQNAQAATVQPLAPATEVPKPKATVSHVPEVVEDFVRNFLVQMGMTRTAESFQTEWYELSQRGRLRDYQALQLPDVYAQHRVLEGAVEELRQEVEEYREAARLAKEKYVRLKKERDYHRMHHRRIVQEKDRLLTDVKRMKQHFSSYEPTLQELKKKYQAVTKEKMLACLERDRALSEVGCLQSTLHSVQHRAPTTGKVEATLSVPEARQKPTKRPKAREVPPEPSNPHRSGQLPVSSHLSRTGGLQQSSSLHAHHYAINRVSLHPTKEVLVTASDDHSWKMWALTSGELLMTGEGHEDWLACADFHPSGLQLVTASGDGTVKVWDFDRGSCVLTFSDHQQPVWGCGWHWSGDYVASGGMDHCCKVWDAHSGQCVMTLRGHADSVNTACFLPFSNTLCSCSADKTISLWDIRTGLCVQTYYGHQHSCNDVRPTLQGLDLYSCDCFGTAVHWDMRTHTAQAKWDFTPHTLNALALDPAGATLACACGDGLLRLVDTAGDQEWVLEGHADGVLSVCFNTQATSLVSSASDGNVIVWQ